VALKDYPRRPIVRIVGAGDVKQSRWREIVAAGIGAFVAGAFSIGVAIWNGSAESERGQCQTAVTVITDDQLNASLNMAERRAILIEAQRKVRDCIND